MVTSSDWWDFQPGDAVDTREGYPGVVEAVLDGPGPGNEAYQVTLDNGKGGGIWSASELTPRGAPAGRRQASATVAHTDYPELGDILVRKPPPPSTMTFDDYIAGLYRGADSLYGAVDDVLDKAAALRRIADDGGDHGGSAMVAVPIPQDVAQNAAVDGGLPPEDMHVTLAYLPNPTDEELDATHSIVHDIAAAHPPLSGTVGGAGQFPAGDDGVPHYAPVDMPGLAELQTAIMQGLSDAGVNVAKDHGFTPHMTRTYLPEGQPGPPPMPSTDVQAPHVVVAEGPDWTHYALGSPDNAPPQQQPASDAADLDKAAGFWSDMLHGTPGPGGGVNFDWCRFRKNQACIFPHTLDLQSTIQRGQPVWQSQNRGHCGRNFEQQSACPVGEASQRGNQFSSSRTVLADDTAPTLAEPNYITKAEARGNSRPVSREEYRNLAYQGKGMLDQMYRGKSPITGLDNNWNALKQHAYSEVQKPWGGATIDAHTGVPLESNADRFALTVKPPTMNSVSVHEKASPQEFHRAMDMAKERFRPLLENQSHHLGIFHDDENHRIDMDPVMVVNTPDEVEKIGAQTHAIGGAFHFKSGDGYWPPHIEDDDNAHQGAREDGSPDFNGPGHWRSQAEAIQPGYTHVLPEDEAGQ